MNRADRAEESADLGNTDIKVSRQEPQYVYWFLTWNNYPEQIEQIEQWINVMKHECDWFVIQEEVGESGTPHLQGSLKLKKRQRRTQLSRINTKVHWEPTKCLFKANEYCSKEATRNGQQWIHGIELPKPLKLHEPRGWQLEVMDIIRTEPDERTIHWFWEPNGKVGKSVFAKYLVAKHNALVVNGKSRDIFHALAKNPTKRELFVCDVPREAFDYINYGAIEMIKNGLVFSGKYEGAQLIFNCPHVIVFANQPPNTDTMSMDRWHIVQIAV